MFLIIKRIFIFNCCNIHIFSRKTKLRKRFSPIFLLYILNDFSLLCKM